MAEPVISCLCVTSGRTHLLEEAIECFHRQDEPGEKELIVVNNHPDQELIYSHPEVVVVNVPRKIATLGDARNFMASIARGDVLVLWDDDDIHLPWRLRVGRTYLDDGAEYFRPRGCWWWQKDKDPVLYFGNPDISMFAGAAMLTARCWSMAGGYRSSRKLLDDRLFDHEVDLRGIPAHRPVLALRDYAYLYRFRWSWNASDDQNNPFGWECRWPAERTGRVELCPHWDHDHVAVVESAMSPLRVHDPCGTLAREQAALSAPSRR